MSTPPGCRHGAEPRSARRAPATAPRACPRRSGAGPSRPAWAGTGTGRRRPSRCRARRRPGRRTWPPAGSRAPAGRGTSAAAAPRTSRSCTCSMANRRPSASSTATAGRQRPQRADGHRRPRRDGRRARRAGRGACPPATGRLGGDLGGSYWSDPRWSWLPLPGSRRAHRSAAASESSGIGSQEGRLPGLVHHLVDRLVELSARSRTACSRGSIAAGLGVPGAECVAGCVAPSPRRGSSSAARSGCAEQLVPGRVVERAQHARRRRAAASTGARRSASGTAGSPSKSSTTQPASVRRPGPGGSRRGSAAPRPARRSRGQLGVGRGAPCRRARASSGTAATALVQPAAASARPARPLAPRRQRLGAERRGQRPRAPRRWPRRAGAPRRRSRRRPRRRAAGRAPRRRLRRVQVAHAGRGQRPAVGGRPQVLRRDGQDGAGSPPRPVSIQPSGGATCSEPSRRSATRHLQVGVGPGRDPPEHLEDGGLAEDQAGVALLAGQHQAARVRARPAGPALNGSALTRRTAAARRPARSAMPRSSSRASSGSCSAS